MKAGSLHEKVLVSSISLAVVVAVATSTGLIVGICGQFLTCLILILVYDTVVFQSLGTLWEVLKKEVKLGALGIFFLFCIFSDYLRFIAGGIVALRCLILLGIVKHKDKLSFVYEPPASLDTTSPEKLMSPPPTNAKSHLKPRFEIQTPKILSPMMRKLSSWMTPVSKTSRSSPVPFYTASMTPSRQESVKFANEISSESPPLIEEEDWQPKNPIFAADNPNDSNKENYDRNEFLRTVDVNKPMEVDERLDNPSSRISGVKHSADTALTPYQPRKRSKLNSTSYAFSSTEDNSLARAVLPKFSQDISSSQYERPVLKRKERSYEEREINEESLKAWLADTKVKRRKVVVKPSQDSVPAASADTTTKSTVSSASTSLPSTSSTTATPAAAPLSFSFGTAATSSTSDASPSVTLASNKANTSTSSVQFSIPADQTKQPEAVNEKQKHSVSFGDVVPPKQVDSKPEVPSFTISTPAATSNQAAGFSFGLFTDPKAAAAPSAAPTADAKPSFPSLPTNASFSFGVTPAADSKSSNNKVGGVAETAAPSTKSPPSATNGSNITPGRPPLSTTPSASSNPSIPFGIAFSDKGAATNTSATSAATSAATATAASTAPPSFTLSFPTGTASTTATTAANKEAAAPAFAFSAAPNLSSAPSISSIASFPSQQFGGNTMADSSNKTAVAAPVAMPAFGSSSFPSTSSAAPATTFMQPSATSSNPNPQSNATANPFGSFSSSATAPAAVSAAPETKSTFSFASSIPTAAPALPGFAAPQPFGATATTNTPAAAGNNVFGASFSAGPGGAPGPSTTGMAFGGSSTSTTNTASNAGASNVFAGFTAAATNTSTTTAAATAAPIGAGSNVFGLPAAATPAQHANPNPFSSKTTPGFPSTATNSFVNTANPAAAPAAANPFAPAGLPSPAPFPSTSAPTTTNPFSGSMPNKGTAGAALNSNPFNISTTSAAAANNPFPSASNTNAAFGGNMAPMGSSKPAANQMAFGGNTSSSGGTMNRGFPPASNITSSMNAPFGSVGPGVPAPVPSPANIPSSSPFQAPFAVPAPSPSFPGALPFVSVPSTGSLNGNPYASAGAPKKIQKKIVGRK